jgi:hypothetical protein
MTACAQQDGCVDVVRLCLLAGAEVSADRPIVDSAVCSVVC